MRGRHFNQFVTGIDVNTLKHTLKTRLTPLLVEVLDGVPDNDSLTVEQGRLLRRLGKIVDVLRDLGIQV
jgi:hypothetical protein